MKGKFDDESVDKTKTRKPFRRLLWLFWGKAIVLISFTGQPAAV